MSAAGWGELDRARRAARDHRAAARALHRARLSRADRRGSTASSTRSRTLIYRVCRIDKDREQRWNAYALSVLAFSAVGDPAAVPDPAHPERPALQPDRHGQRAACARVQHRRQLRDQHELAVLRRREHAEPPHPDDGADGPELRVGGRRHGRDGRASSAACRGSASARSATSGSTSCAPPSASCCRSRSSARSCCSACGVIQNTHGFTTVHTVAGATQQIPGGPVASQISIKQLGTNGGGFFNVNSTHPFEGGDQAGRLLRAVRDPRHPLRAGLHVRADDQGQAPGLCGRLGDGDPLARVGDRRRRCSSRAVTRGWTPTASRRR